MIRHTKLKNCPICGRRLKHKIGTERWYCSPCSRYFTERNEEVYLKRAANQKEWERVENPVAGDLR